MTSEEIKNVAEIVAAKSVYCTKEVLTSGEASKFLGVSMSYLYKLTMRKEIPHYKPNGKCMYFNRHELEQWAMSNRVNSISDAQREARCNQARG